MLHFRSNRSSCYSAVRKMTDFVDWLWVLPAMALIMAGIRVSYSADAAKHRFLLLLIAATTFTILLGNLASVELSIRSYARFWLVAYVAVWSLTALALTEACTRSLERYEHFGRIGRRIINTVLCLGGASIGGWLLVAPQELVAHFFRFFQTQGYFAHGSLVVLGLSIWIFSRWARLKLPVNSRRSMMTLTVFCLGETALGAGVTAEWPSMSFYLGIAWTTICWVVLAALWVRRPQESEIGDQALDAAQAAAVLAEMESTNRGLAGVFRRGG